MAMTRIIILISGAMLLIINFLSAQIVPNASLSKPSTKNEIGLAYNSYAGTQFIFRRELKENKYWRVNGSFRFADNYHDVRLGFGIEHRIPLTKKFSLYHGWNVNVGNQNIPYFFANETLRSSSVSIGYRLGARYDFNKHFFIGIELNPQIGVSRDNYSARIISQNSIQIAPGGNHLLKSLGQGTLTMGVKF